MNGPIGRPSPPTTAITRMSITGPMPTVPGAICPFIQVKRMPAGAARKAAKA